MKLLMMSLLSLISVFASAASDCDITTSLTPLSSYEINRELLKKPMVVCVDSNKFSRYDLERFAKAGAHLRIDEKRANYLGRYDISSIAKKGKVSLFIIANSNLRFSRYDLETFLNENVTISLINPTTKFSRYDLERFVKNGRIRLIMDSSLTTLDRYDLVKIGTIAQSNINTLIILRLTDNQFSNYDIKEFRNVGIRVVKSSRLH